MLYLISIVIYLVSFIPAILICEYFRAGQKIGVGDYYFGSPYYPDKPLPGKLSSKENRNIYPHFILIVLWPLALAIVIVCTIVFWGTWPARKLGEKKWR